MPTKNDKIISDYKNNHKNKELVGYFIDGNIQYLEFDEINAKTGDGIDIVRINSDGTYDIASGIEAVIDWKINLNNFQEIKS